MKTKIALISALAMCGAFFASATPASAADTKTTITIKYKPNGGFEGLVKSAKASCKGNRLVKVYKVDRASYLYQDHSESSGKWDTGDSGRIHGDFYTSTPAKGTCTSAKSPTIHT